MRRDKRAYVQCYRDMAQANPCAATHVLLGEAYMRIQMPEVRTDIRLVVFLSLLRRGNGEDMNEVPRARDGLEYYTRLFRSTLETLAMLRPPLSVWLN